MTMKVTEVGCSFFSPCVLLGEAEDCADTCSSADGAGVALKEENAPF